MNGAFRPQPMNSKFLTSSRPNVFRLISHVCTLHFQGVITSARSTPRGGVSFTPRCLLNFSSACSLLVRIIRDLILVETKSFTSRKLASVQHISIIASVHDLPPWKSSLARPPSNSVSPGFNLYCNGRIAEDGDIISTSFGVRCVSSCCLF